jgi:hypothetical protein
MDKKTKLTAIFGGILLVAALAGGSLASDGAVDAGDGPAVVVDTASDAPEAIDEGHDQADLEDDVRLKDEDNDQEEEVDDDSDDGEDDTGTGTHGQTTNDTTVGATTADDDTTIGETHAEGDNSGPSENSGPGNADDQDQDDNSGPSENRDSEADDDEDDGHHEDESHDHDEDEED